MKVELRFEQYVGKNLFVTLDGPTKIVESIVENIRNTVKTVNKNESWPFQEKP